MDSNFEVGKEVSIDGHSYLVENTVFGGMGMVLLCSSAVETHSLLYRNRLAAKVFFPDGSEHRMRNELKVWKSLNHDNIAPLLAIGHVDDWLCATMPWFIDGAIQASSFRGQNKLIAIKTMLSQVVRALDFAYKDHGVLHLDIKPGNILTNAGSYYVGDWGIAKFSVGNALNFGSNSGGTIPYMSPERFSAEPKGVRADIYSVGMVALEMLTGKLPFMDVEAREMARVIMSGECDSRIFGMVGNFPSSWRNFILRSCCYDEGGRPQSYRELSRLLDKLEV